VIQKAPGSGLGCSVGSLFRSNSDPHCYGPEQTFLHEGRRCFCILHCSTRKLPHIAIPRHSARTLPAVACRLRQPLAPLAARALLPLAPPAARALLHSSGFQGWLQDCWKIFHRYPGTFMNVMSKQSVVEYFRSEVPRFRS
jgi:hypothetical protein